ncbi:MAG: hypothetical protein SGILL_008441, partial [Bacillariaceae sp.]
MPGIGRFQKDNNGSGPQAAMPPPQPRGNDASAQPAPTRGDRNMQSYGTNNNFSVPTGGGNDVMQHDFEDVFGNSDFSTGHDQNDFDFSNDFSEAEGGYTEPPVDNHHRFSDQASVAGSPGKAPTTGGGMPPNENYQRHEENDAMSGGGATFPKQQHGNRASFQGNHQGPDNAPMRASFHDMNEQTG